MKNTLTHTQVKKIGAGEQLSDGGGLRVGRNKSGSLWFTYRYSFNGKQQTIGCGGADTTLAQARNKRDEYEKLVKSGKDPRQQKAIVELQTKTEANALEDGVPFRLVFEQFWEDVQKYSINNEKDRKNWRNSVYTYFEPILDMPITDITHEIVADLVRDNWLTKNVMMDKTLEKANQAIDYATAKKYWDESRRSPFDKRLVKKLLPKVDAAQKHHEAIDFTYAPAFYRNTVLALKHGTESATKVQAAQMILFSALRFENGGGMHWEWIEEDRDLIAIPADFMKGRRKGDPPFLQQLTEPMKVVLQGRREYNAIKHDGNKRAAHLVFPQEFRQKDDNDWRHISDQVVCGVIKKLNPDPNSKSPTTHGLRSTFREWCRENDVPNDLAERCLDHKDNDMVQAAYLRSDLWGKRQRVMDDWARFLMGHRE